MDNKAMERKLAEKEALSVLNLGKEIAPGLYELSTFIDDVDYCDPIKEYWIWSIGKHKDTGQIFAATDARFYQNQDFICLWLR